MKLQPTQKGAFIQGSFRSNGAFIGLPVIIYTLGTVDPRAEVLGTVVLAPLVVFDSNCNRIGMGGGFYDRSFEFRKNPESKLPRLIGVAHEFQKVDQILPEDWDVRLDRIVTDQAIY